MRAFGLPPIALLALLGSSLAQANSSDMGAEVSDNVLRAQFADFVSKGGLKDRLISFAQHADPSLIENATSRARFIQMRDQGLVQDIQKSNYVFYDSCIDAKDEQKDLTTQQAQPGSPQIGGQICVSSSGGIKSDQYGLQSWKGLSEMIGLFLHDHARHFGIDDADHSFAYYMSRAYRKFGQLFPTANDSKDGDQYTIYYNDQVDDPAIQLELVTDSGQPCAHPLAFESGYNSDDHPLSPNQVVSGAIVKDSYVGLFFTYLEYTFPWTHYSSDEEVGFAGCGSSGVKLRVFDRYGVFITEVARSNAERLPSFSFSTLKDPEDTNLSPDD